jgi:hypothetical protein
MDKAKQLFALNQEIGKFKRRVVEGEAAILRTRGGIHRMHAFGPIATPRALEQVRERSEWAELRVSQIESGLHELRGKIMLLERRKIELLAR